MDLQTVEYNLATDHRLLNLLVVSENKRKKKGCISSFRLVDFVLVLNIKYTYSILFVFHLYTNDSLNVGRMEMEY